MENAPADTSQPPAVGTRTVRRIEWMTLLTGSAAATTAWLLERPDWSFGLSIGAALAWLNFFWLKRGIKALVASAMAQESAAKPRLSAWVSFTAAFRYALIAFAIYVIFHYLHVPLLSMVVGLCALAAATIAASVWEILNPVE